METMMYLYKQASESGKQMAEALGLRKINHGESAFRGHPLRTVVNWGCGDLPRQVRMCNVINPEHAVNIAVNKRKTFDVLEQAEVSTVLWTTDRGVAQQWLDNGARIAVRGRLEGRDGDGLQIVDARGEAPEARLYTKVVEDAIEYRITVCAGRLVAHQQKVPIHEGANPDVRTTDGGWGLRWINRRYNAISPLVIRTAIDAVDALGLDFGGVDVLYDGMGAYVLEVNTAPELTPTLLEKLSNAIKELLPQE